MRGGERERESFADSLKLLLSTPSASPARRKRPRRAVISVLLLQKGGATKRDERISSSSRRKMASRMIFETFRDRINKDDEFPGENNLFLIRHFLFRGKSLIYILILGNIIYSMFRLILKC